MNLDLNSPHAALIKEMMERDGPILKPAVFPRPKDTRNITGITVNDGMSPYEYYPPKLRFKDISEYINEKGFHAYFPESYTPLSSYFVNNNIEPFCQTEYDDELAHGMITIAGLIELTSLQKPWALYDINDLPIIKAALQRYYDQLRDLPEKNKTAEVRKFLNSIPVLLNLLENGKTKWYVREGKVNPGSINIVSLFKKMMARF